MSDESEFSTENLLTLIDQIKETITTGELSEDSQEHVWNALVWDKNDPHNKEMIKYLFTGWWIHQRLPDVSSSDLKDASFAGAEPRTNQDAT